MAVKRPFGIIFGLGNQKKQSFKIIFQFFFLLLGVVKIRKPLSPSYRSSLKTLLQIS